MNCKKSGGYHGFQCVQTRGRDIAWQNVKMNINQKLIHPKDNMAVVEN